MHKITPPADLPAAAIGFVATREDRPERMAMYLADGRLNTTFAYDQTLADIREVIAPAGYSVDERGYVFAR